MATKRSRPLRQPAPVVDPAPRLASRHWLILSLLAAAISAVFSGVLRNGWIMLDDPDYVYKNPHVMRGVTPESLGWALLGPHSGNWHPLTSLSHMLDVQWFGLEPMGHHAVSLALHVLTAVLLAVVLHRVTGAWWRSVLVTALFALHPLRVESVAWVSERKDVLSGLFFVLTLCAYHRWTVRPDFARYVMLLAAFTLGIMAKPMLVTLPFVLVLLDIWPLGRWRATSAPDARPPTSAPARGFGALVLEKWPLFALALASSIVTLVVQRREGSVASIGIISAGQRLGNALLSHGHYLATTFWPRHLTVYYPYERTLNVSAAVAVGIALLAVTTLAVTRFRRQPYVAVGWAWYAGMMMPVIGLVQVGAQAYADRYTYLPTIGLMVALVWGLAEIASRSRAGRVAAPVMAVIALAVLSVATVRQVALWKDSRTLFTQALAVTRENFHAHEILGAALLEAGEVREAVPHLEEAMRLAPRFSGSHATLASNLGSALGRLGRYDEAIAHLRVSLRRLDTADLHHNLAYALARTGRLAEAIPEYEAALALEPDKRMSLVQLGVAFGAMSRFADAERSLRRALELDPADLWSRRMLALATLQMGRVEDAIAAYREVLRRSPTDLDALTSLAWIRATCADAKLRDGAEAVRLAGIARDLSPEPTAALYSILAAACAEAGRFPDALWAGERAVALARSAGAADAAADYAAQLREYRAGRPFHVKE